MILYQNVGFQGVASINSHKSSSARVFEVMFSTLVVDMFERLHYLEGKKDVGFCQIHICNLFSTEFLMLKATFLGEYSVLCNSSNIL